MPLQIHDPQTMNQIDAAAVDYWEDRYRGSLSQLATMFVGLSSKLNFLQICCILMS